MWVAGLEFGVGVAGIVVVGMKGIDEVVGIGIGVARAEDNFVAADIVAAVVGGDSSSWEA